MGNNRPEVLEKHGQDKNRRFSEHGTHFSCSSGCSVPPIWHMSYSQYYIPNLMDMGSLLGDYIKDYTKRTLMSTVKGRLIRLILTVAHMYRMAVWTPRQQLQSDEMTNLLLATGNHGQKLTPEAPGGL